MQDDPRGFTAKVSDFGLSRLLPDQSPKFGSSSPEYTGTITHMAPELLEHGGMSRASDVYSFGILSELPICLTSVKRRVCRKWWSQMCCICCGCLQAAKLPCTELCSVLAVWEALMGESAYQGISKMQVMFGVVSEDLRPVFPPNTPPWYAQIATASWRKDPKRRCVSRERDNL